MPGNQIQRRKGHYDRNQGKNQINHKDASDQAEPCACQAVKLLQNRKAFDSFSYPDCDCKDQLNQQEQQDKTEDVDYDGSHGSIEIISQGTDPIGRLECFGSKNSVEWVRQVDTVYKMRHLLLRERADACCSALYIRYIGGSVHIKGD